MRVRDVATEEPVDLFSEDRAALALEIVMMDLNFARRGENWPDGSEYELWSLADGGEGAAGGDPNLADRAAALRVLSEIAGGWLVFDRRAGDTVLVPMDEWRGIYRAWSSF